LRAVIQRVKGTALAIAGKTHAQIGPGLTVLIGIGPEDSLQDAQWILDKLFKLRIFADAQGAMNLALQDLPGFELLLVSQFTRMASTKKGNRPSFTTAASPLVANELYHALVLQAQKMQQHNPIKTGVFGADMELNILNDGPVTFILDSKNPQ
jgi:D-aminoacyl-tRNA deacylase